MKYTPDKVISQNQIFVFPPPPKRKERLSNINIYLDKKAIGNLNANLLEENVSLFFLIC